MSRTGADGTPVQHGVRFCWPGETEIRVSICDDLDGALAIMDTLASAYGVTVMEPVTRPVPEWSLTPDGLPAAIRYLAEARVDDQLDDSGVRAQLAVWLADRTDTDVSLTAAWRDLLAAVRAHRAAEDGPLDGEANREQLVLDAEARAVTAVHAVIGGAL